MKALGLILTLLLLTLPVAPYPDAPLCDDHDNNTFHTLWNDTGCHYDHEHGSDPFTGEVAAAFPGFDLFALLGGVGVGHTNPSSPMENTHKHGGFKWNVQLAHPQGCTGFEGADIGVNGSVIQYHNFGDANHELEGSIHSAAALLRQCKADNPVDYGYIYTVQHVNYGQRVTPYQGTLIPYPNNFQPAYDTPRGPYWSIDCVDTTLPYDLPQCRRSLAFIRDRSVPTNSTVTSKNTGTGPRPDNSTVLRLLWRVRDTYQVFDFNDMEHPFTYPWVCSTDNGATYSTHFITPNGPTVCIYNNSTSQVHEIAGVIPAEWDNLEGFDTDPEAGRVTAEGYTTRYGTLNSACVEPGEDCHPIRLERAYTGFYGSVLVCTPGKCPNIVPYLPERDIYFNGVSSGWIGTEN
jgi:hypothetical protein